jgi:hypothetical protein
MDNGCNVDGRGSVVLSDGTSDPEGAYTFTELTSISYHTRNASLGGLVVYCRARNPIYRFRSGMYIG